MLASYVLSFSVVPSFARFLLTDAHDNGPPRGFFGLFERGFNRLRDGYGRLLEGTLNRRVFVLLCSGLLLVVSVGLTKVIGLDFFPAADVGLIKLHYRAPPGTRIERTEQLVLQVEEQHPQDHPRRRVGYHQRYRRRAFLVQPRLRAE